MPFSFQSFREFNSHYAQRRSSSSSQPPLVVNRVKVTFANEPGEGSGVARGFYTALAEALLVNAKLPALDVAQVGSLAGGSGSGLTSASSSKAMTFSLIQRLRGTRDARLSRYSAAAQAAVGGVVPPTLPSSSGSGGGSGRSSRNRDTLRTLSYDARTFHMTGRAKFNQRSCQKQILAGNCNDMTALSNLMSPCYVALVSFKTLYCLVTMLA